MPSSSSKEKMSQLCQAFKCLSTGAGCPGEWAVQVQQGWPVQGHEV